MHSLKMTVSWVALVAVVFAGACDELTGNADGGGGDGLPPPDSGADTVAPPPEEIVFKNANETVSVDFADGTEEFVVVPYSVSATATTGIAYTVKVAAGQGSKGFKLERRRPRPSLRQRDPRLWARWQRYLRVERRLRSWREQAGKARLVPRKPVAGCEPECGAGQVCHDGACTATVTIDTAKFASGTITTTVQRKGQNAAILVDDSVTVESTDLDAILDKFDNLIYARDVVAFGNPPLKDGEPTLSSDKNGDGLVWLVITPKVNETMEAVGFFVADDDFVFGVPLQSPTQGL